MRRLESTSALDAPEIPVGVFFGWMALRALAATGPGAAAGAAGVCAAPVREGVGLGGTEGDGPWGVPAGAAVCAGAGVTVDGAGEGVREGPWAAGLPHPTIQTTSAAATRVAQCRDIPARIIGRGPAAGSRASLIGDLGKLGMPYSGPRTWAAWRGEGS